MNDSFFMQILQAHNDVRDEEFGLSLRKSSFAPNVIPQISSIQIIHYEIEILSVLEGGFHIDQKRVIEICQKCSLVHDRIYRFLINDLRFLHFFHCIDLIWLFTFNFPYFPKASLPDRVHHFKGVFICWHFFFYLSNHPLLFFHGWFFHCPSLCSFLVDEKIWNFFSPARYRIALSSSGWWSSRSLRTS